MLRIWLLVMHWLVIVLHCHVIHLETNQYPQHGAGEDLAIMSGHKYMNLLIQGVLPTDTESLPVVWCCDHHDFHMLGRDRDEIVYWTLQEINNNEISFLNFGLWHDDYFTLPTHTNTSDFSHRSGLCQLEQIGWKSAAIQKFSDTLTHETCQFQPKTDLFAIAFLGLVYAHLCIL